MFKKTTTFLLLFCFSLPAYSGQAIEGENHFSKANAYTVKVKKRVKYPFIKDKKGSFSGAGFLIEKNLGWFGTLFTVSMSVITLIIFSILLLSKSRQGKCRIKLKWPILSARINLLSVVLPAHLATLILSHFLEREVSFLEKNTNGDGFGFRQTPQSTRVILVAP